MREVSELVDAAYKLERLIVQHVIAQGHAQEEDRIDYCDVYDDIIHIRTRSFIGMTDTQTFPISDLWEKPS
jgi:hypothetical protein